MNDRNNKNDCSRIICWRRWGAAVCKKSNEIIANPQRQINLQAAEKSTAGHFSGSAAAQSPGESGRSGSLHTVSMTELYDTVYPPREPVADGFLYNGIYLFVGAPKVGKSFFMAQLAYHVAMGVSVLQEVLWGIL